MHEAPLWQLGPQWQPAYKNQNFFCVFNQLYIINARVCLIIGLIMVNREAITGAAGEAVGQGVSEGVGVGAGKQNEEACRAHEQLKFKTGLDEAARATH